MGSLSRSVLSQTLGLSTSQQRSLATATLWQLVQADLLIEVSELGQL